MSLASSQPYQQSEEGKKLTNLITYIGHERDKLRAVGVGMTLLIEQNSQPRIRDINEVLKKIAVYEEAYQAALEQDRAIDPNASYGISEPLRKWINEWNPRSDTTPPSLKSDEDMKIHVSTETGKASYVEIRLKLKGIEEEYKAKNEELPEHLKELVNLADKPMNEIVDKVVKDLKKLRAILEKEEEKKALVEARTGRVAAGGRAIGGTWRGT